MNITRTNKNKPEINHLSKSFLVISTNYQIETLYHILIKNPSLVNTKDQKNETFLSYAIKRKNIDIAELILTSPILDLLFQDTKGNSYLHLAVIYQLDNIIKLLLKKGININLQNNNGNTPLHFAYNTGDIKFIALLIENNADLNIKNNDGLIPEEIRKDSLNDNINLNKNLDKSNNSNDIKANDYNNNNNEEYDNTLLSDKNKINKTIQMNWDDTNNKTHSSKNNTLKYSLVNFSYSDDDDNNEEEKNNINDGEKQIDDEKKSHTDNTKEKTDNLKSSDIFDLTSSLTYQEKVANVSSINSHIVGTPKVIKDDIIENDEDIVNIKKIKTNENKFIYDSLINNSKGKKIYITETYKTQFDKEKKINLSNTNKKCNTYNNINKNNIIDYSTSISKEERDIFNNDEDNEIFNNYQDKINMNQKNNNDDNTITYHPDFNDNFSFSAFGTIKESLNKRKDINNNNKCINLENQQLFNNSLKNIHISYNNPINSNNVALNINNNNVESISQQQQNFLNSKSNIDLYSSDMTADNSVNKSKIIKNSQDSLYIFLLEIKLEKYYNIMNSNGFDDIKLLINQTKSGVAVTDIQLKEAGIDIPGDRAKILIRLQEKAGNFIYHVPKSVYYQCTDVENYMNDYHIKKLYEWLRPIKVDNYLENFIDGGYHCIELMLLQMESKNPITDAILRDDLGIKKIGHRARIINKLLEEGKKLNNKLKSSMLIVGNGKTEKICECIIY